MEDNRNFETHNEEQENQQEEKRFTRAEVEDMIKRRLARERKKNTQETANESQDNDRENALTQRELAVMAKERLIDNNLPLSLAKFLRFTNEDELEDAIEEINNLKNGSHAGSWGQRQKGGDKPDQIRKAMGLDRK